jgi:hypothetical protein
MIRALRRGTSPRPAANVAIAHASAASTRSSPRCFLSSPVCCRRMSRSSRRLPRSNASPTAGERPRTKSSSPPGAAAARGAAASRRAGSARSPLPTRGNDFCEANGEKKLGLTSGSVRARTSGREPAEGVNVDGVTRFGAPATMTRAGSAGGRASGGSDGGTGGAATAAGAEIDEGAATGRAAGLAGGWDTPAGGGATGVG